MVEVVEDFEAIREQAQYCRLILYKAEEQDGKTRIRIRAGRLGYDGTFDSVRAKEIMAWLRVNRAVAITGVVDDPYFFA